LLVLLLAWLLVGWWNSVKPLPPGTRVISIAARVAEPDIEFLSAAPHREILSRAMSVVDHAEQLIVVDQSPLARELAQALLVRKHLRPNLKIIVITDPAPEAFGGTPAQDLQSLERAGVIVARVRLDKLRDSNPVYSGLWRLLIGWWSDPFEEVRGGASLPAWSRQFNHQADQRQIMIADDGSGIWTSLVGAPDSGSALGLRGAMAHDILDAELKLAAWSTEDDRLPGVPPAMGRSIGAIDARFLTEGAIGDALVDSLAASGGDDQISICAHQLGDRRVIAALLGAAQRGARVQLLLDPLPSPNLAVAGELAHAGNIQVRWNLEGRATGSGIGADGNGARTQLSIVRHHGDFSVYLGSASFTRRALGDLNLEAAVELRMPAKTSLGHGIDGYFARRWSAAAAYPQYCDESSMTYWSYRIAEATGLASF
jgi:PLD-like domain